VGSRLLGFVLCKKERWGRLYSFVLLSLPPYKKGGWRQGSNHVCKFLFVPNNKKGVKRIGFLGGLYMNILLSPPVFLPLPEVSRVVMFNLWVDGLVFFVFLLCNRKVGFPG
jgi:hypothetical protein